MIRRALLAATVLALAIGLQPAPAGAVLSKSGTLALELQGLISTLDPVVADNEGFVWEGPGVFADTTGSAAVLNCEAWGQSQGSVLAEVSLFPVPMDCEDLLGSMTVHCDLNFSRVGAAVVLTGSCRKVLFGNTTTFSATGAFGWVPTNTPPSVSFFSMAGALALTGG